MFDNQGGFPGYTLGRAEQEEEEALARVTGRLEEILRAVVGNR
jgi:hypothetical protein